MVVDRRQGEFVDFDFSYGLIVIERSFLYLLYIYISLVLGLNV